VKSDLVLFNIARKVGAKLDPFYCIIDNTRKLDVILDYDFALLFFVGFFVFP